MTELSTLYLPVGQAEFEVVRASGFSSFPTTFAAPTDFLPRPRLQHVPEGRHAQRHAQRALQKIMFGGINRVSACLT